MNAIQKQASESGTAALIYCRVSDRKQKTDGHGLESQEHRCRQYAQERGLAVEMVFPDDITGGGDFMKRPAMRALLAYLDSEKDRTYVVIFDDLKRFARDTEFHLQLRREFAARGASVECLNFKFEDTPEGRFIETVIAAQGQLEREQNSRQVVQKMKARVEKGYYVFHPPIGYRYAKDKLHGKLLVRDEPAASILTEALEGYANGRFGSQVEVKRFFERQPDFPATYTDGSMHVSRVKEILQRAVYAGYVDAPNWGISLRKGHHEPLIGFETFERIQERLNGVAKAPVRKDINEDFPLRGFVLCDDCGQPVTSCWSKGRNRHYPYYLCDTPGCESHRRSVPRSDIEQGAQELLRLIQPTRQLFDIARAMFIDAWEMRLAQAHDDKKTLEAQIKDTEDQIEALLDRIVEAASPSVIQAYEKRIDKLERQKIRLSEQSARSVPPQGRFEEFIEHALHFLANPWNIYEKGSLVLKRTVLKLVFAEPLRYSRETGYRTAKTTLPFKVLAQFSSPGYGMVEPIGIEPTTS